MDTRTPSIDQILQSIAAGELSAEEGHRLITARPGADDDGGQTTVYTPLWRPDDDAATEQPAGDLLVFDHDTALVEALRPQWDGRITLVRPGGQFAQDDDGYRLRPDAAEDYERLFDALAGMPAGIVHFWSRQGFTADAEALAADLRLGLFARTALVKTVLARGAPVRLLGIHTATAAGSHPQHEALAAFARTVNKEQSRLRCREVGVQDAAMLTAVVLAELARADGEHLRYIDGRRHQRWMQVVTPTPAPADPPFREGGAYLITGGAGGLGRIVAGHLLARYTARVVLCGRSPREVADLGPAASYVQADIATRAGAHAAVATARQRLGRLDGIIHAAGVTRDGLLTGKRTQDIAAVLAPKLAGTLHLDAAIGEAGPETLILFSALAGVLGNPGQVDYAYANAFLDGFADWREAQRAAGRRQGRTLAIAWPLWRDGGMRVDAATAALLRRTVGLVPMRREDGVRALETALGHASARAVVACGDTARLHQVLGEGAPAPVAAPARRPQPPEPELAPVLAQMVCDILRVEPADIDADVDINDYGFDSITFTTLANRINERFDLDVTPALFFELTTLGEIAAQLDQALAGRRVAEPPPMPTGPPARPIAAPQPAAAGGDIAIIGMAGRFPGSRDLTEFWRHLVAADDLIEEVPAARWDWRAVYGDPAREPDKTQAKWGGFIPGVAEFDPLFFGISPREAERMDPQQRLFLSTVWLAIEDAGIRASSLAGSNTGVFVGAASPDYYELLRRHGVAIDGHTSVGVSFSVLANRVSHALDLRGPSRPVDTACSSSLVAVHQAVEAIRSGACAMAIAGGVNVVLSPTFTIAAGKAGMLSPEGRCKTFDKDANGYVRGEGVAAVLLKPLAQALADGDPIHALIKASAENHGGHTGSLTTPNPTAQAELLVRAYTHAGIDPATVGYIEVHGTGTALGDPVEVNGLKSAFNELYRRVGHPPPREAHCALGAVKTNIGHLETAAGIAGLVKVALAMRHRWLPANLHLHTQNPYVRLEDSPFCLLREGRPWTAPRDAHGAELPLRAGVSSFGFGGSNAHVVLESVPPLPATAATGQPQLIVLSARNEARLREYAAVIATHIDAAGEGLGLADLAYTLQTGREPMSERLALVAEAVAPLAERLRRFAAGQAAPGVHHGSVAARGKSVPLLAGKAGEAFLKVAVAERELDGLAPLWVSGVDIDFRLLHGALPPRRIHLPGYPFAREHYWIPEAATTEPAAVSHPLIQQRLAGAEPGFALQLSGAEFFLTDHVVRGRKTLPGVVYIELLRAAGEMAAGAPLRRISNLVWLRPVTVDNEPVAVSVRLRRAGDGLTAEVGSDGSAVHAQARLGVASEAAAPRMDIATIVARCDDHWSREACYAQFHANGFLSGPGFQPIDRLSRNTAEALAVLVLPAHLTDAAGGFVLHPALMDGALQTVLGLLGDTGGTPWLPFAAGEIVIHDALPPRCVAHARRVETLRAGVTVDIDIADGEGRVLVSMRRLAFRALVAAPAQTLCLQPVWVADAGGPASAADEPTLVLGSPQPAAPARDGDAAANDAAFPGKPADAAAAARLLDALAAEDAYPTRILWWAEPAGEVPALAEPLAVMGLLRAHLRRRPGVPLTLCYIHRDDGACGEAAHQALYGFARSLHLEHPQVRLSVIGLAGGDPGTVVPAVEFATRQTRVRYRDGRREVLDWAPLPTAGGTGFKAGGVYLITGGAGGLGLLVARHLAATHRARLVLAGRRPLNAPIEAALAGLREAGGEAAYMQADVSDPDQARRLVGATRERFGGLDGVLHAAGVLRDGLLAAGEGSDAAAVLAPKVRGAMNLHTAIGETPLALFVLFSSAAGAVGNPGQADYGYANAFLDAFAQWRDGRRGGRTLAIAWPLWQEGGMQVDAATVAALARDKGVVPLPSAAGLALLETLSAGDARQVLVLHGEAQRLRGLLADTPPAVVAVAAPSQAAPADVLAAFRADVMADVQAVLKLPAGSLRLDDDLSAVGFDSLSFTMLANRLNDRLALNVAPTVFFQFPTLAAAVAHLHERHGAALAAHYRQAAAPPRETAVPPAPLAPQPAPVTAVDEPIAIVGMAARLPGAATLDAFWDRLVRGDDLVTEVPANRWDWRVHHGDPLHEPGKTLARWGGFIDDVDRFDNLFFGISPREAQHMDPQHRLFLETVWAALEDGGIRPSALSGSRSGVFVGLSTGDYWELLRTVRPDAHTATGVIGSVLPNRVSYLLNLRGPSEAIDTACSSSLVAIHRAVAALRAGECELAIAGGCNLILTPSLTLAGSQAGMFSPDGRCMSFDARANGYVRGEGIGAIVLKPLSRAVADGDVIHALIRGSAVNHGGHAASLTAPNSQAQAEVIVEAHRRAGGDPAGIGCIEAHGTGTSLGDPIEIDGLKLAFARLYAEAGRRIEGAHCPIGSVKSQIGHLEAAAGIAGVIKTVLAMRHGWLPGLRHLETPNPYIDLDGSPLSLLAREGRPWTAPVDAGGRRLPRRAGVSSFGFGGVNAHVVLESLPQAAPVAAPDRPQLIVLSARDAERLGAYAGRLAQWLARALAESRAPSLTALAYSLQTGREPMAARLAFVADRLGTVIERLRRVADGQPDPAVLWGVSERPGDATASMDLATLARAWVDGAMVDWARLHPVRPPRVALPTYPFADTRHWVPGHPLAVTPTGAEDAVAIDGDVPWLRDHVLRGQAVVPGVAHLALAREAALRVGQPVAGWRQVTWVRPLAVAAPLTVTRRVSGDGGFEIRSAEGVHAEGRLVTVVDMTGGADEGTVAGSRNGAAVPAGVIENHPVAGWGQDAPAGRVDLAAARAVCTDSLDGEACYRRFAAQGLAYGVSLRPLRALHTGAGLALADLRLDDAATGLSAQCALLEGALQTVSGLIDMDADASYLPYAVAAWSWGGELPPVCHALARPAAADAGQGARTRQFDIVVADPQGRVVMRIDGFTMRQAPLMTAATPAVEQGQPDDVQTQVTVPAPAADARLVEAVRRYLVGVLADETGLERASIRAGEPLERYGIDSLLIVRLTRRLESDFGELSRTLFFEYQTVVELADYLVREHPERARVVTELVDTSLGRAASLDVTSSGGFGTPGIAELYSAAERSSALSGSLSKLDAGNGASTSSPLAGFQPAAEYNSAIPGGAFPGPAIPAGAASGVLASDRLSAPGQSPSPANTTHQPDEPIAIIGLAGRYPQAPDLDTFWQNLAQGRDSITEIPLERWDWRPLYDAQKGRNDKVYSKWGGFMDGVDRFDPLFFNITPREAEHLDPQERLFLETVWHTVEDAGYSRKALSGRPVGVYVGVMWGEYQLFGPEETAKGHLLAPASSYASIANRISYTFNLHGPSVALDSMCSSSLTAIHFACESLRRGESELALAGGVNVSIHPQKYIQLSQGRFAASDGRCRSFGEGGDGYVPGEGVGAVLLKPLARAEADGDHIYGVIRGSAINHGGKTNGYTVPNPRAQGAVIAQALKNSGVAAGTLSYLEAHGTGTSLGDPIEIAGLMQAFGAPGEGECAIGSVKSNIGHLESAAGIAGLTKVLLQMHHRQLVPSLHSEPVNPNIRFETTPFRVQRALGAWAVPPGQRRRAGISSFGAGGANAHLVVEEYVAAEPVGVTEPGTEAGPALSVPVTGPEVSVPVTGTEVSVPVTGTEVSVPVTGAMTDEAAEPSPGNRPEGRAPTRAYGERSGASHSIGHDADANAATDPANPIDPSTGTRRSAAPSAIGSGPAPATDRQTPTATSGALTTDPQAPTRTPGASTSEPTPPQLIVLSARDEATLATIAERLLTWLDTHPTPALADLAYTLQTGREALEWRLALVVDNTAQLTASLRAHLPGTAAQPTGSDTAQQTGTNTADANAATDPSDPIDPSTGTRANAATDPSDPIDPSTGTRANAATDPSGPIDPSTGTRRSPPPWAIGPGSALPTDRPAPTTNHSAPPPEATPIHRGRADRPDAGTELLLEDAEGEAYLHQLIAARRLEKLAHLWVGGIDIPWPALHTDRRPRRLALPGYPFNRQRYWVSRTPMPATGAAVLHPLLDGNDSTLARQCYRKRFSGSEPYLDGHRVGGVPVLPGVVSLAMARAALMHAAPELAPLCLEGIVWSAPLLVDTPRETLLSLVPETRHSRPFEDSSEFPPGQDASLQRPEVPSGTATQRESRHAGISVHAHGGSSTVAPANGQGADGQVRASTHGDAVAFTLSCGDTVHVRGRARRAAAWPDEPLAVDALRARCPQVLTAEAAYARLSALGLAYGEALRSLHTVWIGEGEVLAELHAPAPGEDEILPPALLDGALQALVGLARDGDPTYLPYRLNALHWHGEPLTGTCLVHAMQVATAEDERRYDLRIADEDGRVRVWLTGLSLRRAATVDRLDGLLMLSPVWRTPPATIAAAAGAVLVLGQRPPAEWVPATGASAGGMDEPADPTDEAGYRRLFEAANDLPRRIVRVAAGDEPAEAVLLRVFSLTRALLALRPARAFDVLSVHTDAACAAATAAFARTLALEHPDLNLRSILVETTDPAAPWPALAAELVIGGDAREVRHDAAGSRQCCVADAVTLPPATRQAFEPGVYLVSGGAGGLGRLLAGHLLRGASEPNDTVVVLLGRRAPADIGLPATPGGGRLAYRQCDLTDADALRTVVDRLRRDIGPIKGVIQAAGVLHDGLLATKPLVDMQAVLAPKVTGTRNLDAVTADDPLAFFVCFGSVAAALGNAGQTDYACANGFEQGFAQWRDGLHRAGQRHGKTVTMHWPLWAEGGMRAPASVIDWARQRFGLEVLDTNLGLAAFDAALQSPCTTLTVLAGDTALIRQTLLGEDAAAPATAPPPVLDDALRQAARAYVKALLVRETRLPPETIDPDTPFDRFGIDSVMVMDMTRALETDLGPMPKTLFFEHGSVARMAEHLLARHGAALAATLGVASKPAADVAVTAPRRLSPPGIAELYSAAGRRPARGGGVAAASLASGPEGPPDTAELRSAAEYNSAIPGGQYRDEAIAIVGLAGRYPGAPDIDALWDNLVHGRDSVTEVPPERWSWRDHPELCRWGGFIDGVDRFDPLLFNISPREARLIDPQERLFLQTVWHTLEDAGLVRGRLPRQVGVFVGVMWGEYPLLDQELASPQAASASFASIANRVSYAFDFTGPSMAVDTMCSSSLSAVHLACEALRRGECEAAVAGGVNLSLHPHKYRQLAQGRFTASDGRCRSFGEGGDGYVPGEGVGAVLLKPLSRAEADGDTIHALILGGAVNHGGRTNGYTVPTPPAQGEVIARALARAGLTAAALDVIEAHGTGTALGDPIEIAGLGRVFEGQADARCVIGSIKSNIGHLESAAGIAGLTKLILQLRHRRLVPSLHAQRLNPHIDFDATPFTVQRTLADWPAHADGSPRCAGISSFGAGGANAHLVLAEYPTLERPRQTPREPQLALFSAKTGERLDRLVATMIDALSDGHDLAAVAYSLQTGREALEERLAVVADDTAQLRERLAAWRAGAADAGVVQGSTRNGRGAVDALLEGPDGRALLDGLVQRRDLGRLARLWVTGIAPDWSALHDEPPPPRVRLPLYPFAEERYWLSAGPASAGTPRHPLLDGLDAGRTLEGDGLVFSKTLAVGDAVVADHRVGGVPVLPGVGYLEMALAAAAEARPGVAFELTDVVWLQPLAVASTLTVRLHLHAVGDGLAYAIVTSSDGADIVHGKGRLQPSSPAEPPPLDIETTRGRCSRHLTGEALYARFSDGGLAYGPYLQAIAELWANDDEALARLVQDSGDLNRYRLHPGLLDSALQAIAGIVWQGKGGGTALSFAVDRVRLLAPLAATAYAHARRRADGAFDICVADDTGRVCVTLDGVSIRTLAATAAVPPTTEDGLDDLFFAPVWRPQPPAQGSAPALSTDGWLQVGEGAAWLSAVPGLDGLPRRSLDEPDADALAEALATADTVLISLPTMVTDAEATAADARATDRLLPLFRLASAIARRARTGATFDLRVLTDGAQAVEGGDVPDPLAAAALGVLRTLATEQPGVEVRSLDMPPAGPGHAQDAAILRDWLAGDGPRHAAVRRGQLLRQDLLPADLPAGGHGLRPRGVYLIVGGAGGLGGEISRHLARSVGARLGWVGRRAEDDAMRERMAEIRRLGGEVVYLQADCTDRASLGAAVAALRERYGAIHGAIHAALAITPATLDEMSEAQWRAVMDVKLHGSAILLDCLADERPDYVLLFSSAQSFMAGRGMGHYTAASLAQDALARAASSRHPVRSINWGYWGGVGAAAGEDMAGQRRLIDALGLRAIEPAQGVAAFERILANPGLPQVVPFKGEARLLEAMGVRRDPRVTSLPERDRPRLADLAARLVAAPFELDAARRLREASRALDGFIAAAVHAQLDAAGVLPAVGGAVALDALVRSLRIEPSREPLLHAACEALALDGRATLADGRLRIDTAATAFDIEAATQALATAHPDVAAHARLAARCLAGMLPVLRGERPATEVLFPGGDAHLVEAVYQGNPSVDYFNRLVAQVVAAWRRAASGAPLRILEVGAGTGGTTAPVLQALQADGVAFEYHYTDKATGLVQHGRQAFGRDRPSLTAARLDIEADPAGQGFASGGFDLVIAANVLHATADIGRTLAHVKQLLAGGGWLVLCETTANQAFTSLTFGLLDGWWGFNDPQRRLPGGPLLSPALWRDALAAAGFHPVHVLTHAAEGGYAPAQHVFVAQSDSLRMSAAAPASMIDTPRQAPAAVHAPATRGAVQGDVRNRVQAVVIDCLAAVLEMDASAFDAHTPYNEFGVDSILAVEVIERVNAALGITLRTTDVFNYPDIDRLVTHIVARFGDALSLPQAAPTVIEPAAAAAPQPDNTADDGTDAALLAILRKLASGELDIDLADEMVNL